MSYVDARAPGGAAKAAGKIVLLGYEASIDPTADTYAVPTSAERASAVEVVAAALQTLLTPSLMRPMPAWAVCFCTLLLAWLAALAGGLLRPLNAVAGLAGLLGVFLALAVWAYRSDWLVDVVIAPTACLSGGVLGAGYRYWREVRAKSRIVDLFGRYVPKAVVAQLIQQRTADALALGGVKREVTVLFADVRGFTTFAEQFPPEEVLRQLNELLKIMVDSTFANEGTVDKFIGDAILVLFNAPLDQPDHALRAARTAWAIQQGLSGHPSGLTVGIGIHRGEAVVGRVGTRERMEYTAVGSTVNIASRLCSAATSRQIVVSEMAARSLGDEFLLEAQPPIRVKGVDGELATSLLVGRRDV
jgi:class 3 adenylate cyclase